MENYLILARSVTYAQRMQRALARANVRCQLSRAPRELSERGCAYILRIAVADLPQALRAIHGESLDPVQIFVHQNGMYREVSP